MGSDPIRVQLAEDHEVVRTGFRYLLDHEDDIVVVAESADGLQACRDYDRCKPDVLVIDISMAEMNGLEAMRRILARHADARILALSMHEGLIAERALQLGARGFVSKQGPARALITAIRKVMRGERYVDPSLGERAPRVQTPGRNAIPSLSKRELEVCMLLSDGQSVSGISERLHLSEKTVYTYRANLFRKLGVATVVELDLDPLVHAAADAGVEVGLALARTANEAAADAEAARHVDHGAYTALLALEQSGALSATQAKTVLAELLEHGHDVTATDLVAPAGELARAQFIRADLTDFGQAREILQGAEAVVHLANIPAPGLRTPAVTFNDNMTMNFNVFSAAAQAGLSRVVWASSETTLGLPFDVPPRYAPVDEDHYPFPTSTYALSKVASETVAGQIAGWSGIPFVALRFSNILGPADYQNFPSHWDDPARRKWNMWGYIDERDAAVACRLALSAPDEAVAGSPAFIIAAADTVMDRPSADLLAEVFPGTRLTREIGEFETLLGIDRAREHLGFEPAQSRRDHVAGPAHGS